MAPPIIDSRARVDTQITGTMERPATPESSQGAEYPAASEWLPPFAERLQRVLRGEREPVRQAGTPPDGATPSIDQICNDLASPEMGTRIKAIADFRDDIRDLSARDVMRGLAALRKVVHQQTGEVRRLALEAYLLALPETYPQSEKPLYYTPDLTPLTQSEIDWRIADEKAHNKEMRQAHAAQEWPIAARMLRGVFTDPDIATATVAMKGYRAHYMMSAQESKVGITALLSVAKQGPSAEHRAAALHALRNYVLEMPKQPFATLAQLAEQGLTDPSPKVRNASISILKRFPVTETLRTKVVVLFQDPSFAVQLKAFHFIHRLKRDRNMDLSHLCAPLAATLQQVPSEDAVAAQMAFGACQEILRPSFPTAEMNQQRVTELSQRLRNPSPQIRELALAEAYRDQATLFTSRAVVAAFAPSLVTCLTDTSVRNQWWALDLYHALEPRLPGALRNEAQVVIEELSVDSRDYMVRFKAKECLGIDPVPRPQFREMGVETGQKP